MKIQKNTYVCPMAWPGRHMAWPGRHMAWPGRPMADLWPGRRPGPAPLQIGYLHRILRFFLPNPTHPIHNPHTSTPPKWDGRGAEDGEVWGKGRFRPKVVWLQEPFANGSNGSWRHSEPGAIRHHWLAPFDAIHGDSWRHSTTILSDFQK